MRDGDDGDSERRRDDGETLLGTTVRDGEGRECCTREREDESVNEKVNTGSLK